ncbi:sensor domain-containing protein [Actinoplanes sp. NBRC 103695]|uniref:sensor histidine kinase n=1 Tax=Actinoplanes sp. NBRC 103695 TaxID=3032202 RepID=UPI0024A41679|nr:sensor domain-containing protein [Actinoplanes sp. NBRC 103695]GLY94931.1 histidine kinase [Actinoplanes sp. NBRC 103695]
MELVSDEQLSDFVWRGVRGTGAGAASFVLGVLNFPLFVLWLAALIVGLIPGLGQVVLPLMTRLVRARADLERRRSTKRGIPIATPYAPRPAKSYPVGWRRFRWILQDVATWRDFAWLIPGAIAGVVLGAVSMALPIYGFEGIFLIPLWVWLGTGWYGYGAIWPIESVGDGFLSLPQGAVILALALLTAPWLRSAEAWFARLFLAPTRAAELRLRVAQLTETRADTVDAQAAELRRIERDLHDGAQARLSSLGMTIGLAEELMERDPAAARKLLAEARDASHTALIELRHLVRGIHPPVLAERGLDGAVRALALSLPVPTVVDGGVLGRLETPVESACYFVVAEALANIVKHSGATSAWISIRHEADLLVLMVGDDGRGGADPSRGTGLHGMGRRLAAFDGTMSLSSPPGGPTVVTMELPCALSSPKTSPSSGTA